MRTTYLRKGVDPPVTVYSYASVSFGGLVKTTDVELLEVLSTCVKNSAWPKTRFRRSAHFLNLDSPDVDLMMLLVQTMLDLGWEPFADNKYVLMDHVYHDLSFRRVRSA